MNPWTFVITVVDPTGSSLAITPPTADLEFGAMQRYPVLNLSRALGLEQRSPLAGRTVSWGGSLGEMTYFWDTYDSVPAAYYADTPVELLTLTLTLALTPTPTPTPTLTPNPNPNPHQVTEAVKAACEAALQA